eukprot:COSAG02_NODE_24765_length_678_cov_0.972366_2_plen_29_part_01
MAVLVSFDARMQIEQSSVSITQFTLYMQS